MTTAYDEVLWVEDFYYGQNGNGDPPFYLPPDLDYAGTVVTGDGTYMPANGGQTMWNGGDFNPDRNQPYGGMPPNGIAYMRLRELGWSENAAVLVNAWSSRESYFRWDMSFTGHQRDKVYAAIRQPGGQWQSRMVISGYQGFPWSTRQISIPKGQCQIAILLVTAPYEPPTSAQGYTSPSGTSGQPYNYVPRFLRLSNFYLGYPLYPPTARSTNIYIGGNSTFNAIVRRTQFSTAKFQADSRILVATLVSPRVDLTATSAMSVANVDFGVEVEPGAAITAISSLDVRAEIKALSASEAGGFHISTNAGISVETTIPPTAEANIRRLRSTRLVMKRPAIIDGKPTQPRARSTSKFSTTTQAGQVIGRISPYSVQHVYPGVQPTYRWLSIDARRTTAGELISWTPYNDTNGPAWTTPGAYRPQVENYVMQSDKLHTPISYPAVTFDSTKLDHLNITLPQSATTATANGREITFILVGSFNRYRGQLRDSCPILDFGSTTPIDYTTEKLADRLVPTGWADSSSVPSIYTGWNSYSEANPQMSMLVAKNSLMAVGYREIPYFDSNPVVMAITVAGLNSFVAITTIMGTGQGYRLFQDTPREIFQDGINAMPLSFSLGKARTAVPFGGLFQTGSMSLLEVASFNRGLTRLEVAQVSNYLAGVYAPASVYEPTDYNSAYQINNIGHDDLLFTTGSQPVWHLHDNQATKIQDEASIQALIQTVGAIVYLNPIDYAKFIDAYGDPDNA